MERQDFRPEVHLDHTERGQLAAMASTEGYKLLHRIFRAEVDRFVLDLINTPPNEPKAVWAKHVLAKAAAQFYAQVTNRVNEEIVQYTGALREVGEPTDPTENLLDLGEIATAFDVATDLEEGLFDE